MTLAGFLTPNLVLPDLKAHDRWSAIDQLADHLVSAGALPEESRTATMKALRHREHQGSTGVGDGVAIPHCFSDQVSKVAMVFGKSVEGIEFAALDNKPVHFVVLFVVPRDQHSLHLGTLAAIAKSLNNTRIREKLAKSKRADQMISILSKKASRG